MLRHLYLPISFTLLFVGAVVACSSSATAITGTDAGASDNGNTVVDPTPTPVITTDAAVTTLEPAIYAHSPTTLYRFSATTNTLTTIADFTGCTSDVSDQVTDLAIAADGTAFVSTYTRLSKLNLATAVCTPVVSNISGPSSLAFVPNAAGLQQLVAYSKGTYEQVDTVTGALSPLGTLGGGYEASGDIANFDGGTFLSVVGRECDDCLFQVNPLTGAAIQNFGDLGTDLVYGLAVSSSALYGFSANGVVIRAVPLADGGLATSLVFDAGTPSFFGAATGPAQ